MATGRRSGSSAAVQYEEIRPHSEWKEEDRANFLIIHAPDFVKSQLKITYSHSKRALRVTGERKISSNKWERFNQTFPLPQNRDVRNFQARFVNGTLTITMPKSTITQAAPPKPDTKPTTATQDAVAPPKPAASTTPTPPVISQNATTKPKEEKGVEEEGKAAATLQKAPTLREVLEDSEPQNGQEDQATFRPPSSKLDDLAITMPKSTITQATPPIPDPKPTTATQEAEAPAKPAASTTPTHPPVLSQNATTEPKEEKGVEEKGKAAAATLKAPSLQEVLKDSKPQKGQADQTTLRAPFSSKLDDTTLLKQMDQNVVKEKKAASTVGGDQKSFPKQDQEEIGMKRKESSNALPEEDKESFKKRKDISIVGGEEKSGSSSVKETLLEKERPSTYKEDFVGVKVKDVVAAYKNAVKGLAMEMSEDRQTVVNIGVAVLVIAAFGAYLYYCHISPGNTPE